VVIIVHVTMVKTMKQQANMHAALVKTLTEIATKLGNAMISVDWLLWSHLEGLTGYRFHLRPVIGRTRVGFACFHPKLIIELDGPDHDTPQGRARDQVRDAELCARGFHVLRFWKLEVHIHPDTMLAQILVELEARGERRPGT